MIEQGTVGRMVALDAATVAALREHKKRQAVERLQTGPGWVDHDLVFSGPDGAPLHPERFSRTFGEQVARIGRDLLKQEIGREEFDELAVTARRERAAHLLPVIPLHALRHTWATLALTAGVHPKVVQERLGHATISITLDTYSHVSGALHSDAAEQVAGLVLGSGYQLVSNRRSTRCRAGLLPAQTWCPRGEMGTCPPARAPQ
jgi:integrase